MDHAVTTRRRRRGRGIRRTTRPQECRGRARLSIEVWVSAAGDKTRRAITSCPIRGSAHGLHGGGLDFKEDPYVTRLAKGVFVFPEVFLGEGIDMRRCAVLGHALDPATDLDVTIGVLGVRVSKAPQARLPACCVSLRDLSPNSP